MAYYKTCPHCGAALDPSERCDCSVSDRLLNNPGSPEESRLLILKLLNKINDPRALRLLYTKINRFFISGGWD